MGRIESNYKGSERRVALKAQSKFQMQIPKMTAGSERSADQPVAADRKS